MTFDLEPDLDNANVGKYFVFYREYTYIGCSLFFGGKMGAPLFVTLNNHLEKEILK